MNVKLTKVRLSFPHLFKPKAFEKGKEPSYSANFILDKVKDAAQIKTLKDAINAVAKEKWPKGLPKMKGICLKSPEPEPDGSYSVDGYDDTVMFVTAGSAKRIPIVDRDPSVVLAEEDGKPYAGCYVNASIRLWAQDNEFGKRINAQLRAVQFHSDGEPFGEKPADPTQEFGTVEDDGSPVEGESLV